VDHPPDIKQVLDILKSYESRYTYRGWHILRYIGLAGVAVAGAVFYFWGPIKRLISQEGSELAQQTMQDEGLQQEVDRITQQTTNTLLNDPQTVQVTVDFLMRLLQKPETRAQTVSFFSKVLTDPTTVEALSQLLRDPVTIQQLQSSLNTLLNDPTIRASLNDMVFELLSHPQTQRLLENLVMDLFQRDNVKVSTADFFSQVLKYPQVIDAATASSKDVVENLARDEEVHKNLASAGTSAVKRMVIPGFLFRHPKEKGGKGMNMLDVEQDSTGDGGDERDTVMVVKDEDNDDGIENAEAFVEDQKPSYPLPAQ